MAVVGSQLSAAVSEVRTTVNDSHVAQKYGNNAILRHLGLAWSEVLQDVNTALGPNPVFLTHTITTNTTDTDYLLPAATGGVLQIAVRDAVNNQTIAIVPKFGLNEIRGTNFVYRPPFISFDRPWSAITTLYVHFIPSGMDFMHAGSQTIASGVTATTLKLAASPSLGPYDPRVNAYLGETIRLYSSTPLPSGYGFFPWQERFISGYNAQTRVVTVHKAFDVLPPIDGATGAQTYSYEIIPMADPALMSLAILLAAHKLLLLEKRASGAASVLKVYQFQLVAVRRQYQKLNAVREPGTPSPLEMFRTRRRPPALPPYGSIITQA